MGEGSRIKDLDDDGDSTIKRVKYSWENITQRNHDKYEVMLNHHTTIRHINSFTSPHVIFLTFNTIKLVRQRFTQKH